MRVEDAPTRQELIARSIAARQEFEAGIIATRDRILLEEWRDKFDRWITLYGIDPGETKRFNLGWRANKEPRYSEDMDRISKFMEMVRAEGWEEVEAEFEEPSGTQPYRSTLLQWLRLAPPTFVKNGWERVNSIFYLSFKRPEIVEEARNDSSEEAATSDPSGEDSDHQNEVQTL